MEAIEIHKVIIIGSGPAALTAAIYTGRGNLKPLVITGEKTGGQLTDTTDIYNYPGFEEGISGPDLMEKMIKQAENCGAIIMEDIVVDIKRLESDIFKVRCDAEDQCFYCYSIIIATGADAKWLNCSIEYKNRGVSACAVCDGALACFRNKPLCVVGGGDTACEEALYLTKFTDSVTIIHRRDKLRASKAMIDKVMENKKIKFIWNSEIVECKGTFHNDPKRLEYMIIHDKKTEELKTLECQGLFMGIGHTPNTDCVKNLQVELDEHNYVIHHDQKTNVEGVFVSGDCHDTKYRQAITAAGFGCMAAMECEKYLESLSLDI